MTQGHFLILTGGVGGAKLVDGFVAQLGGENVTAIVNTGDDFTHLGLRISPDIDTLIYTLAGLSDPVKGWGRVDETWACMETLGALGGEDWFSLGDRDLAMHLARTSQLAKGVPLEEVTALLAEALGVEANVVPMSNADCAVRVKTDAGTLAFQDYFVARRCAPVVHSIDLARSRVATMSRRAQAAFERPHLAAVVIAPSNPWLSIDPILAVSGMAERLRAAAIPVIAVNPLPGGQAVKGPTAKIMGELGLSLNVHSIANHYAGLVDGMLIDNADPDLENLAFRRTDTIMADSMARQRVAREVIEWSRAF